MRSYRTSQIDAIARDLANGVERARSESQGIDGGVARAAHLMLEREVRFAVDRLGDLARQAASLGTDRLTAELVDLPGVRDEGDLEDFGGLRNDGWMEYLRRENEARREALDAMVEDDRREAMESWRRHAAEWDMAEF